jgi:hypothetical protein
MRHASDCGGDVRKRLRKKAANLSRVSRADLRGPAPSARKPGTKPPHITFARVASGEWSHVDADPKGRHARDGAVVFRTRRGWYATPDGRSFFGGFNSWRKMPGVRGRRVCECPHGPRTTMRGSATALADDAATHHAANDEHGLGLASGAGRNHPISLAKSAGGRRRRGEVSSSLDGGRARSGASPAFGASSEGRRIGSTRTLTRCRVALLRVDSADLETSTRPRAPGKTGPPVEITWTPPTGELRPRRTVPALGGVRGSRHLFDAGRPADCARVLG